MIIALLTAFIVGIIVGYMIFKVLAEPYTDGILNVVYADEAEPYISLELARDTYKVLKDKKSVNLMVLAKEVETQE